MKYRVAVLGSIGKSVLIDTDLGARVSALEAAIDGDNGASSGVSVHNQLSGLSADDHPQYTMWQANETITAEWNFAAAPTIGGTELEEFIEDTIGASLLDSPSIRLNYFDYGNTQGRIEAEIVDEYVQDLVGAMLSDTASVNLTYTDATGLITADVLAAGVDHGGLAGLGDDDHPQYPIAADAETIAGAWKFTAGVELEGNAGVSRFVFDQLDAATDERLWRIFPASGDLFFAATNTAVTNETYPLVLRRAGDLATFVDLLLDSLELRIGAGNDLRLYHNGTNSVIESDTGSLTFLGVAAFTFDQPVRLQGYTVAALPAGTIGDTAYVTDALVPAFGAAVVGGGAVMVPVYFTGAAWFVG